MYCSKSIWMKRRDADMRPKYSIIAIAIMKSSKSLFLGILIGASLAGMAGYLYIPRMAKQWSKPLVETQQKQITEQAEMIEYLRQSGLGSLLSDMLKKVEDELKQNPKRQLSEGTIEQIKSLSYTFKPYKYVDGDSLMKRKVSPERGQLLLMLSGMHMDSVSFNKILGTISFAGADLRQADLKGAHLRGVDLSGADLQGADLSGAELEGANLKTANLWGANLQQAHLHEANVIRADLRWANLNGADLHQADLHESDLTSAQLRKVDMHGAILQWADFTSAFLNESDLTGADMFRVTLRRAQLPGTNLSNANLTLANLVEANLNGTNFQGANLNDIVIGQQDWLSRLDVWKIPDAKSIQDSFKIVDETSTGVHLYQLKKIKK